jgi:hypothetical protein
MNESSAFRDGLKQQMILSARLVSITIFALFSLSLPTRAQPFNRQDLDCAVAATGESARAGTTTQNTELTLFFINRLVAQDDQTNWARVAYDRHKLSRKGVSAELLAKCKELYLQSLHR